MSEIVQSPPGSKKLLLGNEAIVRGLIEGGIVYGSSYPGTPSSEIGNTFENGLTSPKETMQRAGKGFQHSLLLTTVFVLHMFFCVIFHTPKDIPIHYP